MFIVWTILQHGRTISRTCRYIHTTYTVYVYGAKIDI